MKARILLHCLFFVLLLAGCSESDETTEPQGSDSPATATPSLSVEREAELKEKFATTPFKVLHIAELTYDKGPALAVTFSAPLDPQSDWRSALTVQRLDKDGGQTNPAPVEGDWILGEQLNAVYFPYTEPDTRYRVAVSTDVTAITGRMLQAEQSREIHTDRRQQQVSFVSQGTQLSPSLSDGLTVEAVNVPAVDVDFFRVREKQLAEFLQYNMSGSYYDLDNIEQFADLAYSARFDLNHQQDKRLRSVLPITNIDPLQQPGLYFAVMKGAGSYPYEYQITQFSIGDIGFQIRDLGQQALAFAHQVESAAPAGGTQIRLFDENAEVIAETQTNGDGFASFDSLPKDPVFAVAHKGDHYSVLKLSGAAMDLSEYSLPSRAQKPLELFLYSERDLYRPGEEVTVNALLRDHDGKLTEATPIGVRILTPDNRTYASFTWQGDDQAWYSHDFQIPDQPMRGAWRFEATLGNGDDFIYSFNVEDFLPERMKLELQPADSRQLRAGDPIEIDVQGDYLYGAPASGNRLEGRVVSDQARTLFEDEWQDFIFGAEDYTDYDMAFELPGTTLDESGHAQVTLPQNWQGATQPMRITTSLSLFESGGRPVSRSIEHILWPRETLVGVRPTWEGDRAEPNSRAELEIIHVNQNGDQVAAENLNVLVVREDRQYYWRWQNSWDRTSSQQEVPVYNRVLSLSGDERGRLNVPVEYGNYRVEIRDQQQNLLASYGFFAGWTWDRPTTGTTGRPDQVELNWSQDHFAGGDTAELTFDAPYEGRAVITVESNRLLWRHQQTVTAGENKVEIPVSKDWNRHDTYASVNIIRAGSAQRKQLPKRAFGLLHLPLNRENRALEVSLETPDKVQPETTLNVPVTVANAGDEPVHLTLAAVDTGVLSLSRFETPKPHQWFFAARRYNPAIRDTWASFIEQLVEREARQRFGGDADMSRGGEAPQTDVQIVSLYSGKVAVNEQGQAQVDLDLPYFNGELRLMAVAWSANRFGHREQTVKVAAPLVAEVSTPRFLARGDQSYATFDVQNMTDSEQPMTLSASAGDGLGAPTQEETVTLAPQERHIMRLPLNARRSEGSVAVDLRVRHVENPDADINLDRQWQVGLRPPYPAEQTQVDEVLSGGETYNLPANFTSGYETGTRQLLATVSPRPPLNLRAQLKHLFHYPYGCLEQTTSRAWPLLASRTEDLERYDPTEDKRLSDNRDQIINQAIGRIATMQRGDGGFALWSSDGPESHWLTVYATEFLLAARERGYGVDDEVLKSALNRLDDYVTAQSRLWSENQIHTSAPEHYHVAYRAYAALVLARQQQVKLGDLRVLYDNLAGSAATRLPLAQMALALELTGDARRAEEAWDKALAEWQPSDGYLGDYGTEIRDLARTTSLALDSNLVDEPLQQLIPLRNELLGQRWLSTQERWSLYELGMKLDAMAREDWELTVASNGDSETQPVQGKYLASWRGDNLPDSLDFTNPTDQPVYLTIQHSGYPLQAPEAMSEGMGIQRHFYNDQGEAIDLDQVQTGDLILVQLDVLAKNRERIPDALVVDLLPAGFELENQNLASAVKMDDFTVDGQTVATWMQSTQLVHEEFRDDRYVAALNLSPYQNNVVFYLARAVTPGDYMVPPTLVESMYRPWVRAIGQDRQLTIEAAP